MIQTTWLFLSLFFATAGAQAETTEDLQKFYSPEIRGDVLLIKGRIDSHIYDYLAREAKALAAVKVIELNSLGGNTNWAIDIATKIQGLGKTTRLSSGNYCASACAYLFAAGKEREIAADAWIGIHGARLGAGYTTTFQGVCFVDFEDGPVFEPRKKGCREFLDNWYKISMEATLKAFALMEASGVSPRLRETYFAMPDDENWPMQLNVIRKPDWFVNAGPALEYGLATRILP